MTKDTSVKGFKPLLTPDDLSTLMQKPRRYVLGLIKRRQIKGIKFGSNSYRVDPEEWIRFKTAAETAGGVDGFRHAKASGGIRKGMFGFKERKTKKNEPQNSHPEGSE